MPVRACAVILVLLISSVPSPCGAQQEVLAAIQVHGNTVTPDDDIIKGSGLAIGQPFSEVTLSEAAARLNALKKFENVEVLKRYASLTDSTQIVVVIRVDEGPVQIRFDDNGENPRIAKRKPFNIMFVPVLLAEDGYGWTYGARVAVSGNRSSSMRLVFPLTWGGDKLAAAEFQKEFSARWAPRVTGGVSIGRRENPHYESDADTLEFAGRGEWRVHQYVSAGTSLKWQEATLLDRTDKLAVFSADVAVDTRIEPALPRNATYVRGSVERLGFEDGGVTRTRLDANGYLGLPRGVTLAVRALREDTSAAVAPYFKSLLGGTANLRGFAAGVAAGDTLTSGSIEVKLPFTSPLRVAKVGLSAFVDVATAYENGARLGDQKFKQGAGGGAWIVAPLFRVSLMVAHGVGAGTRAHFDTAILF